MNGANFEACVEQFLLRDLAPGDIVIMNNLASHKNEAVRELTEAAETGRAKLRQRAEITSSPEENAQPKRSSLRSSPIEQK